MNADFWKRLSGRMGILAIGALFGFAVYLAGIEIKDLDLWLHLAVGKFIFVNKIVPSFDFLSCTIAKVPWSNHEWLFQIIVYNIYELWGPDGLIKMQMVVVSITLLLLLILGYNREKQLTTVFLLFVVVLIFQQRFTIRPDLFSLLFFVVYMLIMSLHLDKRWSLYALFLVQLLWSNMHGYFFFGPLFVGMGILSEWIKRRIKLPYEWNEQGRLTDSEYRRLKYIFGWVILACLFNPGFVKGALYPVTVFFSLGGENKIFFSYIQELQKPVKLETLFDYGSFVHYKLFIFLSFVSFVFNRRRIDISALFLWIIFLIFSLNAARNTPYFAFAAYLVCATNLMNISYKDIVPITFTDEKFKHLTMFVAKLAFLLFIFGYCQGLSGRMYYDFDKYEHKSEYGGLSQKSYSNRAVDFLVKEKVTGNFFNDFNSGAYLIGRTFPNIKVFIDGRTEVYGGTFFHGYKKFWEQGDKEFIDEAVKKYNLTGALLSSVRQHIPKNVLKYFYEHKDWHLVYFDSDGVIFLRDVDQNKDIIKEKAIDLKAEKTKAFDLVKIGSARVDAVHNYERAYILASLDLHDQALAEIQEALKILPQHVGAHELLGSIHAKEGDFEKAFEHYRIATMLDPFNLDIRYGFAKAYYNLKDYPRAIEQYEEIRKRWPNKPKTAYHLSRVYAKFEQHDKALNMLGEAYSLRQDNVIDILEIGDIIFKQKNYQQALKAYQIALKTKKDLAQVYKKIGLTYKRLKDSAKAKEVFEKAKEINADESFVEEINDLILTDPIVNSDK